MNFQAKLATGFGLAFLLYINSVLAKLAEQDSIHNTFSSNDRHIRSTRKDKDSMEDKVAKGGDRSNHKNPPSRKTTPSPDDEEDDEEEEYEYEDNDSMEDEEELPGWNQPGGKKPPPKQKPPKKKKIQVYFEEQFNNRNWTSQWVHAKNSKGENIFNKFERVYVRKSNNSRPNYGIITNNKGGEYYMISTTFPPINNRNESFVVQFSVQFQARAHCQLVFLRLYDCQFSTEEFGVQTPYLMQVGPYICGTTRTNKLSVEFQEPGKTRIISVDKGFEPVNNVLVNFYALALQPDGTYNIILNTNSIKNGTLKDQFQHYKSYTSICAIGLVVWHSVLDKYFKGQIVLDDILLVNDMAFAEKRRNQMLTMYKQ